MRNQRPAQQLIEMDLHKPRFVFNDLDASRVAPRRTAAHQITKAGGTKSGTTLHPEVSVAYHAFSQSAP
jgi:hypothetical protein